MSKRVQISEEEYERLLANPIPGTTVDMEITYSLIVGEAATASAPGFITGPYKGTYRSKLARLYLNTHNEPASPRELELYNFVKAKQGVTGQQVAHWANEHAVEKSNRKNGSSSVIAKMIRNRVLGFINP